MQLQFVHVLHCNQILLLEVPTYVTSKVRVTFQETVAKCADVKSNTTTEAFKKSIPLIYLIDLVKMGLFYIQCCK